MLDDLCMGLDYMPFGFSFRSVSFNCVLLRRLTEFLIDFFRNDAFSLEDASANFRRLVEVEPGPFYEVAGEHGRNHRPDKNFLNNRSTCRTYIPVNVVY
jgi:hypothetical protein